MSRIDLNIVDRGIQGTSWIAQDTGLTAEHLDEVMEQKTDNSGALNSLPTPFARFYVAREAFRRAMEEHINSKKEAGYAYRQLVSDILDVYELLFNLKYHRNNSWKNGEKLELREWKSADNLAYIKKKMPILFNSIDKYYQTDIREEKLYFLVYTENGKDKLLACSSPLTGFVTPPDMDKALVKQNGSINIRFFGKHYSDLHIRRKSGGEYFRDFKMFEEREQDFKNYMYNELFGSDNVKSEFKEVKEYIRSFKNDTEIRNDYKLKTTAITTDQNDPLVVNGLALKSCDEVDINSYFTSTIIRVPYRISREHFKAVSYQNDSDSRDTDYLLPFKPETLNLLGGNDIDSDIHINRNSVTVYLRYNGKTYQKEYAVEPFSSGMGRIVDLKSAKISFDLGVFPNILSYKEQENNYFKILVLAADEDSEAPNFNIDQISLSFLKQNNGEFVPIRELDPDTTGANFGVKPAVVRSRQKTDDAESGTKFYELFNSSFDAIEVKVQNYTGLLMPIWKRNQPTNDVYTYAIDLGTSNTFISRCKNGENNKPELFKMDNPMVNYLHEIPKDNQISLARRIENSVFDKAKSRIKTEFLPAIIDGTDYKFPIRTALCGIRNIANDSELFDNHNIAFFYEKLMANEDQNIKTDIKWDKNASLLRIFIRELLMIIKCDILQHNGDLDRTHLVWFRPLSFMGSTRSAYQEIWREEPEKVLFIQPAQVDCFSESEAPYYYFKKKDYIKDSDTVTVVDIGGGSTDFVYFKDNLPVMASSVHFGCDVLWENGFVEFDDEKQNGIYRKYADTLRFKRQDLQDLNDCFKHVDNVKTKDIINFWLSNAEFCDVKRNLSIDFKPVFVYHLTAILYYMASMYKDNNCMAPKTVVFSGNGSKYIDNFICTDRRTLKKIIDLVFGSVFGGEHNVNLELPNERKESTCYGGLYRDSSADDVPEKVYQGDVTVDYQTVGDINRHYDKLRSALMQKYAGMNKLYKDVLDLLKKEHVIDNTANTTIYVNAASEDMSTPFNTYYKSQVKQKYGEEVYSTPQN
jgi:hypothetical protein